VFNPQFEAPEKGVEVQLLGSKIESGIYNVNYVVLNTAVTDASGNYEMEIKDEKVSAYRFYVNKENYFDEYYDVESKYLEANSEYNRNFNIFPIAEIELSVKNTMPFDSDDEIRYRFINLENAESRCRDCCNDKIVIGEGPLYSASKTCQLRGDRYLKIEWIVFKGAGTNTYQDSVYCEAFKKTKYSITY
jgi:hypothetical protein